MLRTGPAAATPVAVSGTVTVAAARRIVRVPESGPVAGGETFTVTVQVPSVPGTSVVSGQLFVLAKPSPAKSTLNSSSLAPNWNVTVTDCAAVVPTGTFPKLTLLGDASRTIFPLCGGSL